MTQPNSPLLKPLGRVVVDEVWSGSPVGFQVGNHDGRQCVANMHAASLRYYRTARPGDVTSLEPIHRMTGEKEDRVTYPHFLTGADGSLLVAYRDGGSGNGNEIVNIYDTQTRTWRRRFSEPLFDGLGLMNAYYSGPVIDSQGRHHLAWVWRDTPDCATNHDVSYACSDTYSNDFRTSSGEPIPLPLSIRNTEIVDPVPVASGLLNTISVSVDSRDRPMITYHKFDSQGLTQGYIARRESGDWRIHCTTDWKDRREFSGGGSIP